MCISIFLCAWHLFISPSSFCWSLLICTFSISLSIYLSITLLFSSFFLFHHCFICLLLFLSIHFFCFLYCTQAFIHVLFSRLFFLFLFRTTFSLVLLSTECVCLLAVVYRSSASSSSFPSIHVFSSPYHRFLSFPFFSFLISLSLSPSFPLLLFRSHYLSLTKLLFFLPVFTNVILSASSLSHSPPNLARRRHGPARSLTYQKGDVVAGDEDLPSVMNSHSTSSPLLTGLL